MPSDRSQRDSASPGAAVRGILALPVSESAGDVPEAAAAAFDPRRLAMARHRNGWTKRRLAEAAGLSAAVITQYEQGQTRPSPASLARLALHLGLPVGYFAAGRPLITLAATEAHFRSLRSTRHYERQQALATMSHFAELVIVLSRAVRLPEVNLPVPARSPAADSSDIPGSKVTVQGEPSDEVPEASARALRTTWGLPRGPLPHLLRQTEMHGVAVAIAAFGSSEHIDAFSSWPGRLGRPVMCLSSERGSVLRRRFSAAHELGHLILHPQPAPGDPQHEREADRFAAELLMPARDILDLLPRRLDLTQLIELQQQWGVSVQALLRRCQELGTISPSTYKRSMAAVTGLGWRRQEPALDYQGEWPGMLSAALDLVRDSGIDEDLLARGLCLPRSEIADLLGLVQEQRPVLRLVVNNPPTGSRAEHSDKPAPRRESGS